MMNCPFSDRDKKDIRLYVEHSKDNKERFNKELLSKQTIPEVIGFRKNSATLKLLQQMCVDQQIPINLWQPRIGDYFPALYYGGYRHQQFYHNNQLYLMLSSDKIKEDDFVDGFVEINGSEYHLALEEVKTQDK